MPAAQPIALHDERTGRATAEVKVEARSAHGDVRRSPIHQARAVSAGASGSRPIVRISFLLHNVGDGCAAGITGMSASAMMAQSMPGGEGHVASGARV